MPILCIKGDICRILQGGLHFTSSHIFIYIYSPLCLAAFLSPNILNCPTLIPEGDCLGHSLCLNWYSMREGGREIKQKILFETFFSILKCWSNSINNLIPHITASQVLPVTPCLLDMFPIFPIHIQFGSAPVSEGETEI